MTPTYEELVKENAELHSEKKALEAENKALKARLETAKHYDNLLALEYERKQNKELALQLVAVREAFKTYQDDGIASDKHFDAGIRHSKKSNVPYEYLKHWLKICRPHACATQDDSWGELEKLLAIIMRNYVNFKTHIRPKLEALSTPPPTLGSQMEKRLEAAGKMAEALSNAVNYKHNYGQWIEDATLAVTLWNTANEVKS